MRKTFEINTRSDVTNPHKCLVCPISITCRLKYENTSFKVSVEPLEGDEPICKKTVESFNRSIEELGIEGPFSSKGEKDESIVGVIARLANRAEVKAKCKRGQTIEMSGHHVGW